MEFVARTYDRAGRDRKISQPYSTREEAVAEAFRLDPKGKRALSEIAFNGIATGRDVRFHDRPKD